LVLAAFLTALAYGIAYFPAFFVLARNLKVSTANLYIMLFIGYATALSLHTSLGLGSGR
jgi:hypothetical protein